MTNVSEGLETQQGAAAVRFARRFSTLAVRVGALLVFAGVVVYFSISARGFLAPFNLLNIVEQSAILGVLAYGMSVVIIGGGSSITEGGIDLSIAANVGVCGAVFAVLVNSGHSDFTAVLAALLMGLAIGALNAFAVVSLRILPLLATLATLNIAAGLELTLTQNTLIPVDSPLVAFLMSGSFLGISAMAWAFIVSTIVMVVAIHFTAPGIRLYAAGGNPEAARAAGVPVSFYVAGSYLFAGLAAGLASVLRVSRLSASSPGAGDLLLAILAASLLGTVFSRRFVPTAYGTALAVLFIGVLANGFQLLNVSSYWVAGVQGTLILLVVAATSFARGVGD